MRSEDLKAFDITMEPDQMHELYGSSNFGQGCLLARRLIENQVRYVEVSRGGWDTHDNNFESVAENCMDIDKALSALLLDLEVRGLLKETMVVLTSEFGGPPTSIPVTVAIIGLMVSPRFSQVRHKGGTVYGKMDKVGRNPAEKFIDPASLNATIAHAMGLPPVQYSPSGRPFTVAHNGKPLFDVLA